jgi:Flp pilus assembly protein TadG
MKRRLGSHGKRRGQVIIMFAAALVALLGTLGLVIDVGRLYYSYRALQASTDAAALAGAAALPNSTASAQAAAYSSVSGGWNASSRLPGVTMAPGYPMVKCLTAVASQGVPCAAPTNANALVVRQQIRVPMTFAGVVGVRPITLTATATAAKGGTTTPPLTVALLLDTTASMNNKDSDCGGKSRLGCALEATQSLLNGLSPCPLGQSSCGTATANSSGGGANVANAVDRVGLFTFPPATAATAPRNYTGQGSPSIVKYNFTGSGYAQPSVNTYQIVNWSSDYRSSNTSDSLVTQSNLVSAVGSSSRNPGKMQAIGGVGTYFAQAVYQTQSALAAQHAAYPNTRSVLIVLSDGDANASSGNMVGTTNTTGVYPSQKKQCQQAITAAQSAQAAGTVVYTIAYGASSSGCSTDNGAVTPCTTLQRMASGPTYFFSDATAEQNKNQCVSASRPITNLNQIFKQIVGELTMARLIPDATQ